MPTPAPNVRYDGFANRRGNTPRPALRRGRIDASLHKIGYRNQAIGVGFRPLSTPPQERFRTFPETQAQDVVVPFLRAHSSPGCPRFETSGITSPKTKKN